MFAITTPADIALLGAAIAAMVSAIRLIAGDEPVDLAALIGAAAPMPWPRGVQEEEPHPWRFELLDRRPKPVAPSVDPGCATGLATHPAPAGQATG